MKTDGRANTSRFDGRTDSKVVNHRQASLVKDSTTLDPRHMVVSKQHPPSHKPFTVALTSILWKHVKYIIINIMCLFAQVF